MAGGWSSTNRTTLFVVHRHRPDLLRLRVKFKPAGEISPGCAVAGGSPVNLKPQNVVEFSPAPAKGAILTVENHRRDMSARHPFLK